MPTKAELRQTFRTLRDHIPLSDREAWSDQVRSRALELPELAAAASVFIYASVASEVQTYTLIENLLAMGKTVALPRVTEASAGQMQAVVIHSLKDLAPAPGNLGLLAPRGSKTLAGTPAVTVLPGLAFSPTTGTRLGTGGGFYDRYLAAHPATHTVALAFECQLTDDLPAEAHDRRVAALVTESRRVVIAKP